MAELASYPSWMTANTLTLTLNMSFGAGSGQRGFSV